jgi:hypothetical protein
MSDDGWIARGITLTAYERGGSIRTLTLPCRWIGVVHGLGDREAKAASSIKSKAYLVITVGHTDGLGDCAWREVSYFDRQGRQHDQRILRVEEVEPCVLHLLFED